MFMNSDAPAPQLGDPIMCQVEAAAEVLGVCLGTATNSRRHGFKPQARRHVERFLLAQVLGAKVAELVRQKGLARSTVYASVRVGRQLARVNAAALGFWAAGYCVSTVGLDGARVRQYIREQKELERRQGEFDFD